MAWSADQFRDGPNTECDPGHIFPPNSPILRNRFAETSVPNKERSLKRLLNIQFSRALPELLHRLANWEICYERHERPICHAGPLNCGNGQLCTDQCEGLYPNEGAVAGERTGLRLQRARSPRTGDIGNYGHARETGHEPHVIASSLAPRNDEEETGRGEKI